MILNYPVILNKHLHANALDPVCKLINRFDIKLRITSGRKTKLGDFMPPSKTNNYYRISINGNLHPDLFLLVFLHEYAHLLVWDNYKRTVRPHGKEWKIYYGQIIREYISKGVFPSKINTLLHNFSINPKATFAGDAKLWKSFKKINYPDIQSFYIGDLPEGALFIANNGRIFKKESLVRTRYRCFCLKTNRCFLFHPLADIRPLQEKTEAS